MKLRYGITEADKTTLTVDKETHAKVKRYAGKYHISITEATWLLISYALIEGKDMGEIYEKVIRSEVFGEAREPQP
jgi:hypothetical protein